jgi:hypothetical protein
MNDDGTFDAQSEQSDNEPDTKSAELDRPEGFGGGFGGFGPMSPLPPGVTAPAVNLPTFGGAPSGAFGEPSIGPTPAKKKRKWWKIILGLFLVLVLLIGGCTAVVIKAARGVVGEGNKFLSALYTGTDDAMKRACPGAKREEIALLRSALVKDGWVGTKHLNSFSTNSANGVTTGEVSGSVQLSNGPHAVVLAIEKNPNWCVKSAQVDFNTIMKSDKFA